MKNHFIITVLLAFALAGCTTGNDPANSATNSVANSSEVNKPAEPIDQTKSAGSPTETMKNFIEALKKKDVEGIKKACSEASIESFEKAAKEKNMTLDEYITRGRELTKETTPEMKNEQISGNSGTLDVFDPERKKWETIPFVKEEGGWKIAFEKMN